MHTFDPVQYSLEENEWLIRHVGEPWVVAGRDIHPSPNPNPPRNNRGQIIDKNPVLYPDGVIPASVRPVIDAINELIELEKHKGIPWVGVEAVKQSCQTYLDQAKAWQEDELRGAPTFPSRFSYDSKGRPHRQGVGSDAGAVKTYFDADGNRTTFAVELVPSNQPQWVAKWAIKAAEKDQPSEGLKVNHQDRRIECFCGFTTSFNPESRASFNAARARVSKHLRTAKEDTDRHRELHTAEFGQAG